MKKLVLFFALIASASISFVSCGNKTTKDASSQDSTSKSDSDSLIADTAQVGTAQADTAVVSE